MNLPNVIVALTKAQNNFDSVAYANCFSENATVFDEGKTIMGKQKSNNGLKKLMKSTKP
jgi:ketosteroid isomerase-like protein